MVVVLLLEARVISICDTSLSSTSLLLRKGILKLLMFFVCVCDDSVGHKGKFGHEFLEFELSEKGELRYANDSRYHRESIIRKGMCVSPQVVEEFRRIIDESGILEFVSFPPTFTAK